MNEGTPKISNIVLRNIVLDTYAGNAVFIAGLPESMIENVRLENVSAIGKYGLKAYNIKSLEMINVSVTSREDEDYQFHRADLTR
ncbi:hypothetical protein DFQ01_102168 [Paenibacillus cellulosilyticus]|uniref:Glycosyl hydrolase family 28 n=1 Tax=Paenibacillus cellulosilyticus TaxID=375489 RepID=A0A2V2Z7D5_9BACL|nr:hypothetical protein [Paenibacillus cellulosilyticus]PWW07276.1 hypothetical protein DFQ01_102168 [Paenibacillus cellulosilyticus]